MREGGMVNAPVREWKSKGDVLVAVVLEVDDGRGRPHVLCQHLDARVKAAQGQERRWREKGR